MRTHTFITLVLSCCGGMVSAQSATDPGVRTGAAGAGNNIKNLTANQQNEFFVFRGIFTELNNPTVAQGLGPGFDSNSCVSCHSQPATGGSSPASNPLFGIYQFAGATNTMPSFITANGPVVVARTPFFADGVTHSGQVNKIFTIAGRTDGNTTTCTAEQPDYTSLEQANNLALRITNPT